jgi:hypothetical protein
VLTPGILRQSNWRMMDEGSFKASGTATGGARIPQSPRDPHAMQVMIVNNPLENRFFSPAPSQMDAACKSSQQSQVNTHKKFQLDPIHF